MFVATFHSIICPSPPTNQKKVLTFFKIDGLHDFGQFAVSGSNIQLVRNGGVDVKQETGIEFLPDRSELIVYLTCTPRRFVPSLIMT